MSNNNDVIDQLQAELEQLRKENRQLQSALVNEQGSEQAFLEYWQQKLSGQASYELLQQAHTALCERLSVDSSNLFFNDPVNKCLRVKLCYPPLPQKELYNVNYQHDSLSWLVGQMTQGKPFRCNQLDDFPAEAANERQIMKDLGVKSALCVSVRQETNLLAVLDLSERKRPRHWTDEEVYLSQQFAQLLYRVVLSLPESQGFVSEEILTSLLNLSQIGYMVWERGLGLVQFQKLPDEKIDTSQWLERQQLPSEYLHPDDTELFLSKFQQCLEDGKDFDIKVRSAATDGGWRWIKVHFQATALDEQGKPKRIIATYIDVTQFVEQQRLLEEAWRKASMADLAKSQFLARMSHEIRTPMNAIIGMAHLLESTSLDARQLDYLSGISVSAKDLLSIINDILDFSKIEAGKLEINCFDFNLDKLIDDLALIFDTPAAEKQLEVIYDIDAEVPRYLVGDAERLKQVFINLIGNAIKFTEKGHIILKARVERCETQQVQIAFSVTDTGIGMSDESLAQLFQPFMQADGSITRRFGGTGLGLSICKRLIELMGGSIAASSCEEGGTSFHFTLPFQYGVIDSPVSSITAEDLSQMRALVVDDNDIARVVIAETVAGLGLQTESIDSGKEAVKRVYEAQNDPRQRYDIIFMDYLMPELDGITAAQLIKGNKEIPYSPTVVMISGHDYNELRDNTGLQAIDAFLHKPVSQSRVFDTLAELFGKGDVCEKKLSIDDSESEALINGMKALLVEDNAVNQKVAVGILAKKGVEVDVVENGQQALDLLAEKNRQDFEVILMDMEMPEMDGITATRRIRNNPDWAGITIIAMTANAIKGDRERCLEAGMDGYISKPISPALLYRTLASVKLGEQLPVEE
jgi:signal transduction histidine kinase/CheY-like chemotaxis protein